MEPLIRMVVHKKMHLLLVLGRYGRSSSKILSSFLKVHLKTFTVFFFASPLTPCNYPSPRTGGGQPSDFGTITSPTGDPTLHIPITRVNRRGLRAVHFSPVPLEVGITVTQRVDFDRRMDHMQQHTGQHLLSAIMDTYEGLETLGWSMGASTSLTNNDVAPNMNFVELGRKPTDQEIDEIQKRCNEVISQNVRITVDTPDDAKTDSLPADYNAEMGVVRVVKIEGVDENPCVHH